MFYRDLEVAIDTIGQIRIVPKKDKNTGIVLDVWCIAGKNRIQISFWSGLTDVFSNLLRGKEVSRTININIKIFS